MSHWREKYKIETNKDCFEKNSLNIEVFTDEYIQWIKAKVFEISKNIVKN